MDQANRRRLVKTGTLSAGVLLLAALLLIVNYFGGKYYKRFDWTGSQLYSLSEKTLNVLEGLKRDVEFIVFLSPGQEELFKPTQEVLARYGAASPRIKVRYVDPAKNLAEAQQLSQRFGGITAGTAMVVVSGNDQRMIDSNDLADFDFRNLQFGGQPEITGYKGEQAFTNAIVQISEGRKPKILFTTGHGERSLDDREGAGLASTQQILGTDNFDVGEWASLGQPSVPAGTDLLVVAGPKSGFAQPELAAFSSYLNGGGRMLVLLDPTLGPAAGTGLVATGLEGWLGSFGVKVGQDIVVDPSKALPFFGPETLFATDYGDHAITKGLSQANVPVMVRLSRSVGQGQAQGVRLTELLRTSAEGWGETDLVNLNRVGRDGQDLAGPVPLGVAVESESTPQGKRPLRLVVYGDSDFATNELLGQQGNPVLFLNSLNWLVEREALLGIPPKKTEQVRLTMSNEEYWRVVLLAFALPVLCVVAGAVVFFRRRR